MGSGWSTPPRKEFSRLKLRQPWPKALRTPDFMDGVPGLSKDEQHRVDARTEIHARPRQVSSARCIKESGGQTGLEQPPLVNGVASARQRHSTPRPRGALCTYSMYKSWAFCASFPSVASLACTCSRPPGSHKTIAGLKQGRTYVSSLKEEYPPSLAAQLSQLMALFCTSLGLGGPIRDFASFLPKPVARRRPAL